MRGFKILGGAMALLIGTAANAQPFPPQNPNGPRGAAEQTNYPYPGQCQASTATGTTIWTSTACNPQTNAKSFKCPTGAAAGVSNFTAGGWRDCAGNLATTAPGFTTLGLESSVGQPKFVWPLLNPFDYFPDTAKFPGADYYEIGLHESWGFQKIAGASLFPDPTIVPLAPGDPRLPGGAYPAVPNGMQWTGLVCTNATGCTCPAELEATFRTSYCAVAGNPRLIPFGAPLYTPIWGVGQMNSGVVNSILGPPGGPVAPWSANNYYATWPSVSIRATKDRPVVVRWVNEFPNNHTFCPHPEAADWPCAIDRTFMGVKATIDPAVTPTGFGYNPFNNSTTGVSPLGVNQYGGAQQPDNSWVTHLHGGDIPPATDGFAEKWFGNMITGAIYSPTPWFLSPAFEGPIGPLFRPGNAPEAIGGAARPALSWRNDTYTYPMNQEEALIWFHDHTLGKTHHNVIAGPAGFFPVKDPSHHGAVVNGVCTPVAPAVDCAFSWLDPVTEPRFGVAGVIPRYDLFMAIQDRAFNDDGSINFSNGLGNAPAANAPAENTVVTPGANAMVHPVWIPEYFGDQILVNGVLWPNYAAEPGWYRIRMADGSDSRCYTLGFSTILPASGARPTFDVPFTIIASDQGYVRQPRTPSNSPVTFCPGERLELLVNFAAYDGTPIYMVNSAAAPFPAGESAFTPNSPWPDTNVIMKFSVASKNGPGVKSCSSTVPGTLTFPGDVTNPVNACIALPDGTLATAAKNGGAQFSNTDPAIDPTNAAAYYRTLPLCSANANVQPCISAVRQLYLNERVDGVTGAPLGMQVNGVPFEYKVTETPRRGTIEKWEIINLTVDAHPMHPHLVKHLRVGRQRLNVGLYKTALCGSSTCQPGPSPGNEMPVIPNVRDLFNTPATPVSALIGNFLPENVNGPYSSWKDASQALPGEVTTIIAKWDGGWHAAGTAAANAAAATAPGAPGGPADLATCPGGTGCTAAAAFTYEPVTSGPFVWHCHINSHEDSEMMRTSLVVP